MRSAIASLIIALLATPALACLPPPPGVVETPPTLEQKAKAIFQSSDTIVYGVLTRGIKSDRNGELRVIHVYKGSVTVGARVSIGASWGFDPPMCASMMGSPPPTPKGVYGVFAWSGQAVSSRILDEYLSVMFDHGWLVPAERRASRPR